MSNWPLASSYTTMLQNPRVAFKDPHLQQSQIKCDHNGLPLGMSGAFAVVYKATLPDGTNVAVRAFTSGNQERTERCDAIASYLKQKRPRCIVDYFSYAEKGIRADNGRFYPLVVMQWVPGKILFDWLTHECRRRNQPALKRACDLWMEMINELSAASIAHGDLQHANVMVEDSGALKLVDYDCMCVPKLVGRRNTEIGVDPYQHPGRNETTLLSPDLDNFSSLFIFVVLRALAAQPNLWDLYVEQTQYDKMLIRREDFEHPDHSSLYKTLLRSPDAEVGRLAKMLWELFRADIKSVPQLKHTLFSYDKVRSLLTQKQFAEAIELVTRKGDCRDAPADLQQAIAQANSRVQCLKLLETKIQAGDEAGMAAGYKPALLNDFPAAQQAVAIAKLAPQVAPVLQRLAAAKQQKAWRDFVKLYDDNAKLLDNRQSAQGFKAEANSWRQRNRSRDQVLELLGQPACDVPTLARTWETLKQLGGHPDVEPHRAKIEGLVQRHQAFLQFQQVSQVFSEQTDQALVRGWNETMFKGWGPAEQQRPRIDQARQRLQVVQQLAQLAQRFENPTFDGEKAIRDLAGKLAGNYQYTLLPRVQSADRRLKAFERLRRTVSNQPTVEKTIVEAWHGLQKEEGQTMVGGKGRERVKLAAARVKLLKQLGEIPKSLPPDQYDAQLLASWDDKVLNGCDEAASWHKLHGVAVRRKALVAELQQAIAKSDEPGIAKLMRDPCLIGYPLPRNWTSTVKTAQERVQGVEALVDALRAGDRRTFRNNFDVHVIRQYARFFAPFRDAIEEWVREEVLPREKMGLKPSLGKMSLVQRPGSAGAYQASWTWPKRRYTDECLLAVCRGKPPEAVATSAEAVRQSPAILRWPVTRHAYENARPILHAEDDWDGACVVVWALVDLGFETFASEPLILGRIGQAAMAGKGKRG